MTDTPPPRRSETMEIVTTVVAALNEVITALRSEISAIAVSEKRRGKRLSVYLAMIAVVMLASVAGVVMNYRQGDNVKSIVSYIEDCQKPDTECSRRNNEAIGGAVISISGAVFDSMSCVLLMQPEERTDENVLACRDKYLGAKR